MTPCPWNLKLEVPSDFRIGLGVNLRTRRTSYLDTDLEITAFMQAEKNRRYGNGQIRSLNSSLGIFFVWNVSGPPSLRSSPNIRNVCSGLPFHYAQSSTLLVLKAAAARGFLLWFHKLSLRGPALPDYAHIKQIPGPLREWHSHRKLISRDSYIHRLT